MKTTKCPLCKNKLVEIDDKNYVTSICPKCFSTVFDENNGNRHVIENGISKEDGYNISLDIVYKQFLVHQMILSGALGDINTEDIVYQRVFEENIYNKFIFNHFSPMFKNFKMRQPYMYFNGYKKYFEMSDTYTKSNFPQFFK